jgi:Xaa-Pro aminopeptidase
MSTLVKEKIKQAIAQLEEKKIDLWITFVRETSAGGDPVLPLIYGHDLTWQSSLIISRTGDSIAIVGHYEAEAARMIGAYSEVIPYHESMRAPLLEVLDRYKPQKIALNYSKDDVQADGLSVGLYHVLLDYLQDTPYRERLVSSENIISSLRGRKTSQEIERIRDAIMTTEEIFNETFAFCKMGQTESEIADFMRSKIVERGVSPAWDWNHCPTVNAGPDSPVGHVPAGRLQLKDGQILHIDFGVKQNLYCSDIQRVAYFLKPNENHPPEAVQRGFETVVSAIDQAVKGMLPGRPGWEIDSIAREVIVHAGYPEYKYATGHHLGRLAHDGAGILGPKWERYGNTPDYLLEEGQVFTIEPGLSVPGYGYIGIEEDVLVTNHGGIFLSHPQTNMVLLK